MFFALSAKSGAFKLLNLIIFFPYKNNCINIFVKELLLKGKLHVINTHSQQTIGSCLLYVYIGNCKIYFYRMATYPLVNF